MEREKLKFRLADAVETLQIALEQDLTLQIALEQDCRRLSLEIEKLKFRLADAVEGINKIRNHREATAAIEQVSDAVLARIGGGK